MKKNVQINLCYYVYGAVTAKCFCSTCLFVWIHHAIRNFVFMYQQHETKSKKAIL